MTQRLIQLIELDIQRAYDTGEYQPDTRLTFEEEVRLAGQGQLWPHGPASNEPTEGS